MFDLDINIKHCGIVYYEDQTKYKKIKNPLKFNA